MFKEHSAKRHAYVVFHISQRNFSQHITIFKNELINEGTIAEKMYRVIMPLRKSSTQQALLTVSEDFGTSHCIQTTDCSIKIINSQY